MPRTTSTSRQLIRPFGTQLSFNGTSAVVNVGNSATINPSAGITFSVWVKPIANGAAQMIFLRDNGTTQRCFQFQIVSNGTIEFDLWDSGGTLRQLLSTAVVDRSGSQWSHLVGTYDGTNSYIYINGVQVSVSASLGYALKQISQTTYIGEYVPSTNAWFKGTMDDARIYSTALTGAQVTALYYGIEPPTTNLVGWYKFDEGSGTNAVDSSPVGTNTGTITAATYVTDPPLGITTRTVSGQRQLVRNFGTCLSFAGGNSGNNVAVKASGILQGSTNLTISCWINRMGAQPSSFGTIYKERNAVSGNDYIIFTLTPFSTFQLSFYYQDDAGTSNLITSTSVVPLGWHHVAVVKAGTGVTFYIDGVSAGTGVLTATSTQTNSVASAFGNEPQAGNATFNGLIDEGKLYTTNLSTAQIQAIYYGQNNSNTDTNLVGYYRFNEGSGTAAIDSSGTQANGVITGATYTTNPPLGITTRTTVP